jgi:hypothetical protein
VAGGTEEGKESVMDISFTQWLWVNWAILFLTAGAFWTLGCFVMTALLGAIRRSP